MSLAELVEKNRSYRRFKQDVPVSRETLEELVALTTKVPSGMNAQSLRYVLSNDPEMNGKIFENLAWAGALPDWPGPSEGERPAAYIVVLNDTRIKSLAVVDSGIAMQTILLGAVERGLGGCIFGSVKKAAVAGALQLPEQYEILWVIALGVPVETVVLEALGDGGDTAYHRDAAGFHYVPKRPLSDLIINETGPRRNCVC